MKEKNKAIFFILCSSFCFAMMNTFVRLAGELPFVQKSFFRNFIAAVIAFAVLKKQGLKFTCKPENRMILFLRAFCGTAGLLCNFYAIDRLVLADATMLNKMSPFFAVIFSALFLKDKTSPFQIGAVIAAFAGSMFIVRPTFANMDLIPSLIGFLGGIGAGAAYTCVSHLGRKGEKGPVIVLAFSLFSCIVTLPMIILNFQPMTLFQTAMLLCTGLAAAGGQFAITAAYSHAPAKEVSVYDYSQVVFSALLGFFFFSQIPDTLSIIGYVIIISVAIVMFAYNNRKVSD